MKSQLAAFHLVIAAHGSSFDDQAAGPALAACASLAPLFKTAQAGLIKGEPSLRTVLAALRGEPVIVLPWLMAHGFFATRRLPVLIADVLGDQVDTVRLAPVIGESPRLKELALQTLIDMRLPNPSHARVVVVGHGTTRNPDSGASTFAVAERIAASGVVASAVAAFIDQEPRLEALVDDPDVAATLILPWFAGTGPHVYKDIPESLGLPTPLEGPCEQQKWGKALWMAPPVAQHPLAAEAALECALLALES